MSTSTTHRNPGAALPNAIWSAWSCDVRVVVTESAALDLAIELTRSLMNRVDLAASRFRFDSELTRVNTHAGRPVAVSRLFVELTQAALTAASQSDGAFDPTIGLEVARVGYDRDILLVQNSDAPLPPAQDTAGRWGQVVLDTNTGLITVPRGAALDLGATAKAQTADRAAAEIARRTGASVLVEIGGDLAVAGPARDWQIGVAERAGGPGQQITLHRGGVATSTTTIRRWQRGAEPAHHIIDPATGRPADGPWRSVSIAASSALSANALSTAAIVRGERAVDWLNGLRATGRLVDQAGHVTTVGAWPTDHSSTRPAVADGDISC